MSYHNTTHVSGNQLAEYEEKAKSQDQLIFEHLAKWPDAWFTAERVHAAVQHSGLLTSARRALTNLYNKGLIERGEKVQGKYNHPVFTWRYKKGDLCVNSDIQPAGASIPPLIEVNEKYAIKHFPGKAMPFSLCVKREISSYYPDGWRKQKAYIWAHWLLLYLSKRLLSDACRDKSKPVSLHLQQIRRVIKRIEAQL